jgi:uncharacterized membrane protein
MRAQTLINATAETSVRELSLDETEMVAGGGIHFSFKKFNSGVRNAIFDGAVTGAVTGLIGGEAVEPLGGGLVGAVAGAQVGLVAGTVISAKNAFSIS